MDTGKQYHIIYVEDDPEIVELVSLILSGENIKFTGVCSGRKGLEEIQLVQPDLVLLDIMMPDMDGWEIFKQLKDNDKTASIPVIIISAKSQPIDQVMGLHVAGVEAYICKPFHPQDVLSTIHHVLGIK